MRKKIESLLEWCDEYSEGIGTLTMLTVGIGFAAVVILMIIFVAYKTV